MNNRKFIVSSVVASLAAFAMGCAGIAGEAKPDRKIRVACIGDSITWGATMTNRVAECYPAQLQRLLGDRYEVRNFGDSGSGVCLHPPKPKDGEFCPHPWRLGRQEPAARAFDPDVVVCDLGINDNRIYMREYAYGPDGKPEVEPGSFRRDYTELLRSFSKNGKSPRLIIWTRLAPTRKCLHGRPNAFVLRRELEAVARTVGAEELDMFTPLVPYCETAHYAPDGVHPEGGAQRIIAETTACRILSP